MKEPTLVILAAGMGSRYGGLKQIEPVDEYGNLLIDYSIYDAAQAGFTRVLCIIKKAMEADFAGAVASRVKRNVRVELVFQEMDMLPPGFSVPEGRTKPWGTSHALLCCKDKLNGPFAIINADDYYGRVAFCTLYRHLYETGKSGEQAMVGYLLENTLSEEGAVTRGVCRQDENGLLADIQECRGMEKHAGGGVYKKDGAEVYIPAGTLVSMNMWGFTGEIPGVMYDRFPAFLERGLRDNPLSCEFLLPVTVGQLLREENMRVRVLQSSDQWFGVTYQQDMQLVRERLREYRQNGIYPEKLWN